MNEEYVAHGSTIKTEHLKVQFEGKEFIVDVIEKDRHFKDFNPPIEFIVKQLPSMEDEQRVIKAVKDKLWNESTDGVQR